MATNANHQPIIGFDANGQTFAIGKLAAHQNGGTLHRAVSIFLVGRRGLLIQRRAQHKYHSGGLWANSVCSHPNWGETSATCANRRVVEELGFAVAMRPIGQVTYRAEVGNDLVEHECVDVFLGQTDLAADQVPFVTDEVQAVTWLTRHQLEADLTNNGPAYSAWFRHYMSADEAALRSIRQHVWQGADK